MKRIYNEYGAATYNEDTKPIDIAVRQFVETVWKWQEENDICPRDLQSYVESDITAEFAWRILKRATKMRKDRIKSE